MLLFIFTLYVFNLMHLIRLRSSTFLEFMFRFNLRFLAAVRVACPLALALVPYVGPRGPLGYYRYLLLALLSFLVFRNTTYLDNVVRSILLLVCGTFGLIVSQFPM